MLRRARAHQGPEACAGPPPLRVWRSRLSRLLVAGSLWSKKTEPENNDPPNVIYGKAEALVNKGKYKEAARVYEEVDINHPYSPEARRAILMASYAYYKGGKYDDAIGAADRYLTLHPGTKESDLAQNIIAMSYYDACSIRSATRAMPARRSPPTTRCSSAIPNRVTRPMPATGRASCAICWRPTRWSVGRYYLRQNNFLAAINRFRTVVTDFQTTEQVEEALMRLTEAYMALGIVNEAQTAAAVLGHNFPESKWYRHAYGLLGKQGLKPQEHEGSWITRTWRGATGYLTGAPC